MNAGQALRFPLAALLAAALCGPARAVDEVEPNTMSKPQALQFDGSGAATVTGTIDGSDPDVFSFWARAGETVLIDIDGATADTSVSIHEASGYAIVDFQGDSSFEDEGEGSAADPYLEHTIQNDGQYLVVVTTWPAIMGGDGVYQQRGADASGVYTLNISGVFTPQPAPPAEEPPTETPPSEQPPTETPPTETPPTEEPPTETPPTGETPPTDGLKVAIDIRPGVKWFSRHDPKRRELIPVAILSSRTFDPRDINLQTLTFGSKGDERSLAKCLSSRVYLNRDRRPDVICFFRSELAAFEATDDRGVLRGATKAGATFEGSGMLKVIPEKRKLPPRHGHQRHDHKKSYHKQSSWYRR